LAGGADYVPSHTAFSSDDPMAECEAVLAGVGIGQLSISTAGPFLHSGELVEVLPHLRPRAWPLTVYRVRRSPVPARVRIVFDSLVEALSPHS
jgi:DNA-binding transcriptional LysR family regulator